MVHYPRATASLRRSVAREPATEWQWPPAECSLQPLDAELFCSLLGKGLLVVGDSISEQLAVVIASIVERPDQTRQGDCHLLREWWLPPGNFRHFCHTWNACQGHSRVAHLFTRFPAPSSQTMVDVNGNGDFAWANDVAFLRSFDVILLNTGAHAPGLNISERVTSAMGALLSSGTNATIVYRDTTAGHFGCELRLRWAPLLRGARTCSGIIPAPAASAGGRFRLTTASPTRSFAVIEV